MKRKNEAAPKREDEVVTVSGKPHQTRYIDLPVWKNISGEKHRQNLSDLQDEILAMSIFAKAAFEAENRDYKKIEGRSAPPLPLPLDEQALMGHEWAPLAAALMRRIAKIADEMTMPIYGLPNPPARKDGT